MLNSINLDDRSFEELLAEAVTQIPLYSKEWTNFNVSDPGITVLENLTAFNLLQQTRINHVSDEVRRTMLRLLGCVPKENKAARLLVQAPENGMPAALPAQCQLQVGSLCFETEQPITLAPWSLRAAYAVSEGAYRNITFLLQPYGGTASVFGAQPKAGASLCCILNGTPPTDSDLRLWAQIAPDDVRTPFAEQNTPSFADTRWQYYTADGWQNAQATDETHGFLVSGEITLTLTAGAPAVFADAPEQGCAVRCVLDRAAYDRAPRLDSIALNLYPLAQRETRAKGFCMAGAERIELKSELAARGNLLVYCRESKEDSAYRLYRQYTGISAQGRYFTIVKENDGVEISFDRVRFGYAPAEEPDAVRVVCYDDEMIHHRDLGLVYGFDEQVVELDLVKNLLPDAVSVIAELEDETGAVQYLFVPPGNTDPDTLCYSVLSQEAKLLITHPGYGVRYRLYLCDCAVTQGQAGNIRAGNLLHHQTIDEVSRVDFSLKSPARGQGGQSWETPEEMRLRFAADMRKAQVAVMPSDYETLVRKTPGLCIHKVKCFANVAKNLVKLVVKPYTEEERPKLSAEYLSQIQIYLEKRRMLTTRIELIQPKYVPVDVSAALYIKSDRERAAAEVEGCLRRLLDHVNSDADFGGWVRLNEVYQELVKLSSVESVGDLRLLLRAGTDGAAVVGSDIRLEEQSLCYPGDIALELHSRLGLRKR